ncbi:hypothetical protein N9U50_01970 [Candidatus Pelagibacter sp.]|nr:hypothetical protein [Candidatus Pelagibacter sp.]
MKIILSLLIIIFSLQSLTKADDVRDFEIEGMSVGDSLKDHFSKKKINESEVDWYKDLEKNRYISYAFDSKKFQTYDFVDIWVKYNDKDLKIDTMAGVLYFGDNKVLKNVDDCYKNQKNISDELLIVFKNAQKEGPSKRIFYEADSSGKSSYTDIYLDLDETYQVVIACYDWSDEFLGLKEDHLYIAIRSKDLSLWLN